MQLHMQAVRRCQAHATQSDGDITLSPLLELIH